MSDVSRVAVIEPLSPLTVRLPRQVGDLDRAVVGVEIDGAGDPAHRRACPLSVSARTSMSAGTSIVYFTSHHMEPKIGQDARSSSRPSTSV